MATMTVRTHPAMIVEESDSSILAMSFSPPVDLNIGLRPGRKRQSPVGHRSLLAGCRSRIHMALPG